MAWLEVKLQTTVSKAELITELLNSLGALAVTTQDAGDQPLYEPDPGTTPLWDHIIVTGLFDESCQMDSILDTLKNHFPDLQPKIVGLPDQNWERAWMDDFKPMQFGQRLWIIPSFQEHAVSPNQVVLDPGLAFGTGKHPTTALCLQWLDANIKGGEVVIDYGCGSGILAIAALKLGAKKVYAIDHDPQAIIATNENAKQNNISARQLITLYPYQYQQEEANFLIANILANPLIELAPKFATMLTSQGRVVLSGILKEQAHAVIKAYEPFFKINRCVQLEDWVRIDGYRIATP